MTLHGSLRPLEAVDAIWLAAVHTAAFPGAGWSAGDFAAMLAQPGFCGIAVESEMPCGFVLATIAADQCDVVTIAVAPRARRRGVASTLMSALFDLAGHRGVEWVYLEVEEDNMAAAGLYRKLGFVALGRRRGYYVDAGGHRSDAIRLGRPARSKER